MGLLAHYGHLGGYRSDRPNPDDDEDRMQHTSLEAPSPNKAFQPLDYRKLRGLEIQGME
jgi:hypothetical protein